MTERAICPPEHAHAASHNCYVHHKCGCDACRQHASAEAYRRYKARAYGRWEEPLVSAVGTRRRLEALQAIGWSQARIAEQLGIRTRSFWRWMTNPNQLVERSTHDRVAALYEQIWDRIPPHDDWRTLYSYNRTRNRARAEGWLPPAAWDDIDNDVEPPAIDEPEADVDPEIPVEPEPEYVDMIAVELACEGQRVRLTTLERTTALKILNERKLSDSDIAALLHVDPRTVLRLRQANHIPAALNAAGEPIDAQQRDAA